MQSTVYFLLVAFGSSIVLGEESALCRKWSEIEQLLTNLTCTISRDCYGLSCSGVEFGYKMNAKMQLNACETPPNIEFELNVPRLNIKNVKQTISQDDSLSLARNFKLDFIVERNKQVMVLGIFAHFIQSGSLPVRVPVIKHVALPLSCLTVEETTSQPMSIISGSSEVSSLPTTPFLAVTKGVDRYSNCSITNSTCSEEEICKQIDKINPDGICVCISNYTRNNEGKCIYNQPLDDPSSVSLLLTAILVPIFVILLIVAAVYASIRFRVFQHLRRRMRVQVYEHVLLGEDDEEVLENPVA